MIVTQSTKIKQLIGRAQRVGRSEAPVLLTGESGTGKELFAQVVHDASARADNMLVRVNCAALSRTLIESELFGHRKGAFTGADQDRVGRFEVASGGSLFLDEVSEVPLSTQAKLLRVIENGEFERVGSSELVRHQVRIIAASNRELSDEIRERRFRLDLFHRLNVVQLRIPPLRERSEDIPLLAMHFLKQFRGESAVAVRGFTKPALQLLARHEWPGNVRELRNVVHRACILCDDEWIDEASLELIDAPVCHSVEEGSLPARWLSTELAVIEREIILAAIAKYQNRQIVAEKLGVSQRTLTNKMRRYRESDGNRNAA